MSERLRGSHNQISLIQGEVHGQSHEVQCCRPGQIHGQDYAQHNWNG
jgi:hypothetical protein